MAKNKLKDPVFLLLGAGIIVSAYFSQENVKTQFNSLGDAQKMVQESTKKANEMMAGKMNDEKLAKIANDRYKSGCLILIFKGKEIALSQGVNVIDVTTSQSLPRNTIVCDVFGQTGRLESRDFDNDNKFNPVIADTAYTGDSSVINEAIAKNKRVNFKY